MEISSKNCNVKVALHIRPLLGHERIHGGKDCLTVVPGTPQVLMGSHSFTFDHVYGGGGSLSSNMFEECVTPLVDDLFRGYNGTVLAYGQTGSGKTYTMGTGPKESSHLGLIPQVMNALFDKIEALKHQTEFQLHVSFIEILKEEVKDLLDSTSVDHSDAIDGQPGKAVPGKQPIQIRKTSDGAVTLSGSNEVSVSTQKEMKDCLEQGCLSRATATTDMNNQSSRSHAIFTIILEQKDKVSRIDKDDSSSSDDTGEEYRCAKLHLVDLAGSERAKRAGSDGLRLKEGIQINKGLLALGNVISALGDDKKRKEGLHVPYRDSKLTRLLQASLGGNCKTVMIACVSPADINADETINTLKYANRARNIQNKPSVYKDSLNSDMQRMRQQLVYLQTEAASRREAELVELQDLKRRVAWLETTNVELLQKLHEYQSECAVLNSCETNEGHEYIVKKDRLKRGSECTTSPEAIEESLSCEISKGIDEKTINREHEMLQNTLQMQLNDLDKRLEQKESDMKVYGTPASEAPKQLFQKKIVELEEEKKLLQQERDNLLAEIKRFEASGEPTPKVQTTDAEKIEAIEVQISELKKKQENQINLLKQKSHEGANKLREEIRSIKAQKVQLQHKMKNGEEQFRQWKASHEKQLLQLKKEARRNEFERHKLLALYQRQTMVLQRKTEEAAKATKKLKELLESRKAATRERENMVHPNGQKRTGQSKILKRWIDNELEKIMNVHKLRVEYEKQTKRCAALAEELAFLKKGNELSFDGPKPSAGEYKCSRRSSLSPNARLDKIDSLEKMVSSSSDAISLLASQLSDAEERENGLASPRRWKMLHIVGDANDLLQYIFNIATDARRRLCEKEIEIKEMKVQLDEVMLQQSEAHGKGLEEKAAALVPSFVGRTPVPSRHCPDDTSDASSISFPVIAANSKDGIWSCPITEVSEQTRKGRTPVPSGNCPDDTSDASSIALPETAENSKDGICSGPITEVSEQTPKMVSIGCLLMKKLAPGERQGKLSRWRRSHDRWLIQFKWKWQKPWKLSEWIKIGDEIRNSDETLMRSRIVSLTAAPDNSIVSEI